MYKLYTILALAFFASAIPLHAQETEPQLYQPQEGEPQFILPEDAEEFIEKELEDPPALNTSEDKQELLPEEVVPLGEQEEQGLLPEEVILPPVPEEPEGFTDDNNEESRFALEDQQFNQEDFGVKKPGFFKKIFRPAYRGIFRRSPQERAHDTLNDSFEQLIGIQELTKKLNKSADQEEQQYLQAKLGETLEKFEEKNQKFNKQTEKLKEKTPEDIDGLLDEYHDKQFKAQTVLSALGQNEDITDDELVLKIKDKQKNVAKRHADVILELEDKDKLSEKIERILDQQKGSKFKAFRDLEHLETITENLPDKERKFAEKIKEKELQKLTKVIRDGSGEEDKKEFTQYIKSIPGEAKHHIEILDGLQQFNEDISVEFVEDIDNFKKERFRKFEIEINRFDENEEFMEKMFDGMAEGADHKDMRFIKEFERYSIDPKIQEEIKKRDLEMADNFINKFRADPNAIKSAEIFKEIMQKPEGPDATDFKILDELGKNMTGEQREFIKSVEKAGTQKIMENAKNDDKFFQKFSRGFDTMDFDLIDSLSEEHPEFKENVLEIKQEKVMHMRDMLINEENPFFFEKTLKEIENRPEVKAALYESDKDFGNFIETKKTKLDEHKQDKSERMRVEMKQRGLGEEEIEKRVDAFIRGEAPPPMPPMFEPDFNGLRKDLKSEGLSEKEIEEKIQNMKRDFEEMRFPDPPQMRDGGPGGMQNDDKGGNPSKPYDYAEPGSNEKPPYDSKPIDDMVCTEEFKPVCGKDGETYSNKCYAKKAGVTIKFDGSCDPKALEPVPMPYNGTKPENNYENKDSSVKKTEESMIYPHKPPPPVTLSEPYNGDGPKENNITFPDKKDEFRSETYKDPKYNGQEPYKPDISEPSHPAYPKPAPGDDAMKPYPPAPPSSGGGYETQKP